MKRKAYNIAILASITIILLGDSITYADNLYVSCFGYGIVQKFNSSGTGTTFAGGMNSPSGIAFDRNGSLYVADAWAGTIKKYNSSGYGTTFASGLGEAAGMAFDSSGNLYVSDYAEGSSGTIYKINTSGSKSVFVSNITSWGLAFDSSDYLYTAENGIIEKISSSGTRTTFASSSKLTFSSHIAFDSYGNLFASSSQNGTILKLNTSGNITTFASGFNHPGGLAFDSSGYLYAADYYGIYKFDMAGNRSTFAATGLHYTTGSIVTQVPEPGTFLLIIFGSIIAGRRRKK